MIGAFTAMLPAAFSVSRVPADQVSGAATVMSPAWLPPEPVDTVTLAPASAFCSVVALMTLSLPVAVKPDWLPFAAFEMVTL